MSLLKYVNRLKRIDHFIKSENTGPASEFAKRIGISRSMLIINLDEMRAMAAWGSHCDPVNQERLWHGECTS